MTACDPPIGRPGRPPPRPGPPSVVPPWQVVLGGIVPGLDHHRPVRGGLCRPRLHSAEWARLMVPGRVVSGDPARGGVPRWRMSPHATYTNAERSPAGGAAKIAARNLNWLSTRRW